MEQKNEYTLSFYEAAEQCLLDRGFIRGENFAAGVYVRNQDDTLVMVDGKHYHQVIGPLFVSKGVLRQKYKLFEVANKKAIGLE